ncbi:Shedu anti-phage system protein SduA domain-containing protein [Paenibacillus agricola]|uniref:DUF4263 domain-containing protein n=1 Tax=Paenibacillus agricola TaxID=2716264 RepID=A0ABX0JL21_9BACL|nr:Shedu anti-phage system protein SduA domain-containing protein [Paenibacillus agricola]NHN34680.1 DUF4263 domain-containing protein [Paenibacillus agricola]
MSEIKTVRTSVNGIEYLRQTLQQKQLVATKVCLWGINHNSTDKTTSLKIGRYKKVNGSDSVEWISPKSEMTLDNTELEGLCEFLNDNYEPFRLGIKSYVSVENDVQKSLMNIITSNKNERIIAALSDVDVMSDEIFVGIQMAKRINALNKFEEMLDNDCREEAWQKWFEINSWILGSDYVEILEERRIDTHNIADYLMKAFDGFLDIIEIKRTSSDINFWSNTLDHGNYVPSTFLIKATTQSLNYLYEIEREANNIKTHERLNYTKIVKPKCILIFGRSNDWNEEQFKAYRILNASYTNLTIMTYDQVLFRAKHILGENSN